MQTAQYLSLLVMLTCVALLMVLVPKIPQCRRALELLKKRESLQGQLDEAISEWKSIGEKIGLHNDLRRNIRVGLAEHRLRSARQPPTDAGGRKDTNEDPTDILNALFGDGTARSSKRSPPQTAPSVEDIWIDRTPRPKRGCTVYLHRFECKEIPALLDFTLGIAKDRKPDKSSRLDVFVEITFASLEQLEYPNVGAWSGKPVVHWSTVLEIVADPTSAVSQATHAAKTWANQAIEGSRTDIDGILTPRELAFLVKARERELGWICHFHEMILGIEKELLSLGVR
jgi:hypothetical protein